MSASIHPTQKENVDTTYCQRSGLRHQQVGNDLMVFDDTSDSVHVLNSSAAFIWQCLDCPRTIPWLENALRKEYDLSVVRDVTAMIRRVLDDFRGKGLLDDAAPEKT